MGNCKLCLKKEANQSGSHITSAFLLSSQIGKRELEKGFTISTDPNHKYMANIGAEDIKEDFILCSDCEKRFSQIESLFASTITQKIEKIEFEQNFEKCNLANGNYTLRSKQLDTIIFHLLYQSIIWRASISTKPLYNHFKLAPELEERMRFNLDLFLPCFVNSQSIQTEKDWIKMIKKCKDLFDFIPLVVIKADNIENKEMTYDYFDSLSKEPYHAIINEYFIFTFNEGLLWIDDFFNMKNEFPYEEVINRDYSAPVIGVISNEKYFRVVKKIQDIMSVQLLYNALNQCVTEHEQSGTPLSSESLKECVAKKMNIRNEKS